MKDSTDALARLQSLLEAEEAGGLSAAKQEQLAGLLRDHPETREPYVAYKMLDAWLELEYAQPLQPVEQPLTAAGDMVELALREGKHLAKQGDYQLATARSEKATKHAAPLLRFLDRLPVAIHPVHHPLWFLATATLLTSLFWLVVAIIVWPRAAEPPIGAEQRPGAPLAFTARITHVEEAVWPGGAAALYPGTYLDLGRQVELVSGRLQIQFGDGARVAVEGPALLQIAGRNAMTLSRGKLLARADSATKGFAVQTPVVSVVDLGTEFGMEVAPQQAAGNIDVEVQVFTGAVEVWRADDPLDRKRKLVAGQAAAFSISPQAGFFVKEKKMNRALYLTLAAVLSLPIAESLPAANVAQAASMAPVSFTDASYSSDTSLQYTLGYEFTPTTTILVTHVGYYDRDGDGLASTSNVGIYQTSTTTLVPGTSATVPTGTGGLLQGDAAQGYFRYIALSSPVALTAGTAYRVAGVNGLNGYTYQNYVSLAANPNITMGNGYYAVGGALAFPSNLNTNGGAQVNPLLAGGSFLFALPEPPPAPEPATSTLLGVGGLVLLRAKRRRK